MESLIGFLVSVIIAMICYVVFFTSKKKESKIANSLARLNDVSDYIGKYSITGRERRHTKYSGYTKFLENFFTIETLEYLSALFKLDFTVTERKIKLLKKEKEMSADDIVIFKVLGIILTFACLVLAIFTNMKLIFIFSAIFVFLALFLFPMADLEDQLKQRQLAIEKELPDWIDLLQSVVESGLTLQEAIARVVLKKPGYMSEEFIFVTALTKTNGGKWEAAMEEMAERNDIPALSDLVSDLITAYQRGTAIADTLKEESKTLRALKNARIEEESNKMTVKILPYILFFCFLPFLVLILAPGLYSFMGAL